jgi:DNA invertase Pin-like site-specific DNA recombinase
MSGIDRSATSRRQLEQLRAAGCSNRNTYREKVTGARADRRELNRMLGKLAPGDVVTVTRIDRLARSTFDLFGIVKRIVDAKAQFRPMAESRADAGTSTGRLMFAALGGLADVKRDLIRTRTAEGRSRAKHRGRPRSEAARRRARGATLEELARSYNVSKSTIPRSPGRTLLNADQSHTRDQGRHWIYRHSLTPTQIGYHSRVFLASAACYNQEGRYQA